jgi:hypothetical protein
MPEEDLETSELKEQIDQRLEAHEAHHGEGSKTKHWTLYLSLSTAIIAVIAAAASLESGSNSNEAILEKSEAMLNEARASDQWAYFQAKGMKAAIADGQAEIVSSTNPAAAKKLADTAARYRAEAGEIQQEAKKLEEKVEQNNARSEAMMEHHHRFAISVTLLQIAIALSAIAALTRRKPLWFVSLIVSAGGLALFVSGLA